MLTEYILTKIYKRFEGDVFFPEIDFTQYVISSKEKGIKDEKNPYDYEYIIIRQDKVTTK